MDHLRASASRLQRSLLTWVLGFFGVVALFKLLPKTTSYVLRRFVFGFISQAVFVVIAALLTERIAGMLTGQRRRSKSQRSRS